MIRKPVLTLFGMLIQLSFLFAQEGKLYTVWDGDTVDVLKSGITVDIVLKSDTIRFHDGQKLVYPEIGSNSDVISFIVNVKGNSTEFFNKSDSPLPPEVAKLSGPFYLDLFDEKRNMYVDYFSKYDVFGSFVPSNADPEKIEAQKNTPHIQLCYQQKVTYPIKK